MEIIVHTDGSCSGNPGVGGYAAVLTCNGNERIVRGHFSRVVTNNQMELMACLATVRWANKNQKNPCKFTICTDSKYIIDCAYGKCKDGTPHTLSWFAGRKNEDLWMQLIKEAKHSRHKFVFVKVKGHSDNEMNAKADAIAKEECAIARHELLKVNGK